MILNESRLCSFMALLVQAILPVMHMREMHRELSRVSADAKRSKVAGAGEDPLSLCGFS